MLRLLLHGDAGGFVVGFFGVREDEHQITFQRLVPEYTCPQQPLPASSDVSFLKLDFVCCMGIIWLSSDTCLVLVVFFFCQLCWQLFIPPKGIGAGDIQLTKFPVRPQARTWARHLSAPRFPQHMHLREPRLCSLGKSDFDFSSDEFLSSSSSDCQAQCRDQPGLETLGRYIWAIKIHTKLWVLLPLPLSAVKFDSCMHQQATSVFPCSGDPVPAEVGAWFPWVWPWLIFILVDVGCNTVDVSCFSPVCPALQ